MSEKTPTMLARDAFREITLINFDEIDKKALPEAVIQKIGASMVNVEHVLKTHVRDVDYYVCEFRQEGSARKVFFIDCNTEGARLGFAILDFDTGYPLFGPSERPYTNYTRTEAQTGQGYGTARLQVMNAYSLKTFGMPMYSGSKLEIGAEMMWQALTEMGVAERVPQDVIKSKYRIKQI